MRHLAAPNVAAVAIPAPIGMFRVSALRRIGGYDHETFAEDCDLTLKLLAAGWQIHFEPESIA